jgi:hypothetical protein
MKIRFTLVLSVVAAALLLARAPVSDAANLYRYTNAQGVTVVDYQVPVEYVSKGYEILNTDGVVLRVVPRALTEEEKKDRSVQEAQDLAAKAEEKRLREWDESLMLRYSTVADIEAAKERALGDLRIRQSILKSNKRSLKQQVENYQAQAADLERSGREVDVARIAAMEDMQAEIESTERSIQERAKEIKEVSEAYERDIERFNMLLEVVELRKTLLAQEQEKRDRETADPRR